MNVRIDVLPSNEGKSRYVAISGPDPDGEVELSLVEAEGESFLIFYLTQAECQQLILVLQSGVPRLAVVN